VILTLLFMLGAPAPASQPASATSPPAIQYEEYGPLSDAHEGDDGVIWLKVWKQYVRYRMGPQPAEKHEALLSLVKRASEGGRAVLIRYDAAHGRFDAAAGSLDYPLCSIALDDLRVEPADACRDETPAPAGFGITVALAQAEMSRGNFAAAQRLLSPLAPPADVPARKLFLRLRAESEDAIAAMEPPASPAADRASAAALADFRALGLLEPGDADHQFEIAGALVDLGGYAEAGAIYGAILKKWPNEEYRVAVRRGALHRVQGQYAKALEALDDLVARKGPQPGMRFHYHRGWTLNLLGRYDEAIRELTEGIKGQPEYASAYHLRGCAYAGLGDLRSAFVDIDEAARIEARVPGAATSKVLRESLEEIAALRARLQAAIAAGQGGKWSDACSGPSWKRWERPRTRSPLLPAA
jgi:tetratricopeptide (TPR) repeat protein